MMNEGARLLAAIKHIDSRKECNFQFTTSQGLREIFTGDRRGNAVSEGKYERSCAELMLIKRLEVFVGVCCSTGWDYLERCSTFSRA